MSWISAVLFVLISIVPLAHATDQVILHEKLHEGQKMTADVTQECHFKTTTTKNAQPPERADWSNRQSWRVTMTILAVKDGSAINTQFEVGNESVNSAWNTGEPQQKTPAPLAGKLFTLTLKPDNTTQKDLPAGVPDDDTGLVDGFGVPDRDYYPDHPVAVGDEWDVDPLIAKHQGTGAGDTFKGRCHLDWVRKTDGKKFAHITCTSHTVQHEDGNVTEEIDGKALLLVDVDRGMIVVANYHGTSKYSTAAGEPVQLTGGTEFSYQSHVIASPAGEQAATKP